MPPRFLNALEVGIDGVEQSSHLLVPERHVAVYVKGPVVVRRILMQYVGIVATLHAEGELQALVWRRAGNPLSPSRLTTRLKARMDLLPARVSRSGVDLLQGRDLRSGKALIGFGPFTQERRRREVTPCWVIDDPVLYAIVERRTRRAPPLAMAGSFRAGI